MLSSCSFSIIALIFLKIVISGDALFYFKLKRTLIFLAEFESFLYMTSFLFQQYDIVFEALCTLSQLHVDYVSNQNMICCMCNVVRGLLCILRPHVG